MSLWSRPDTRTFDNRVLRLSALAARERNRAAQRHGPGPTGHRHGVQLDEHYHVVYHVPAENISIPYFREVFDTVRDAYLKIADLGQRAEPQVEWYEDGEVGFETSIPGRLGRYWVVVEAMGCIRRQCQQYMTREQRKEQFRTIPEDGDIVLLEINPRAVEVLGPGTIHDERDL